LTVYKDEAEARAAGLKPGAYYEQGWKDNHTWVVWRKEDLDPNDRVQFIPLEIPTLRWEVRDEIDKYTTLTVNGLRCVLKANELNDVNRFFYNAYQNIVEAWKESERTKRTGVMTPKLQKMIDKYSATDSPYQWFYNPSAITAWMDQDGRYTTHEHKISTEPGTEGMPMTKREIEEYKMAKEKDAAADKKKGIKEDSSKDIKLDKKAGVKEGGFVPFAKKGKRKPGPTGEYKGKNPAGEKK
jgi:hypothetical protein